jgi:prevent-host-death family protein
VRTVNIHQAKTHLSKLLDQASKGEAFIIAKAGKPVAKVVAIDSPDSVKVQRLGFLGGQFVIPDDFDRLGQDEIEAMFTGER